MTDPMVSFVVHNGRATLHDLRTVYSLKDLYRLWEIDYVPIYNSWYDAERQKERERLNRLASRVRL
jgi:hypothetical protein